MYEQREYMRYIAGNFTPSQMVTNGNYIIYMIEMFLLFVGILGNLIMMGALCSTVCLHLNLRMLLSNCCFGFIIMGIGRAMISTPLSIAHITNIDVSSHTYCFIASSTHHASADVVCFSFFFIMLERVAGTIWSKNYEKVRFHWFAIIFILLQWFLPFMMIFGSYLDRDNRLDVFRRFPHLPCQIDYWTPTWFLCNISFVLIGYLTSIIGILIIYKLNIRKYNRTTDSNLSERYQISENIRSTQLLFPLLFLMLIFTALSVLVLVYGSYWMSVIIDDPEKYEIGAKYFGRGAEASQLFDIIMGLYTISFPISTFKCYPKLFSRLRIVVCRTTSSVRPSQLDDIRGYRMTTSSISAQTDYHFDSLQQVWNA